ncbi:DUF1127 domain-containing protein [Pseudomonas paralactis]|uniref:DUF1127 domain-containing protein n=1 Tax=Pseudomonas paralactis TaxID=1615673 RepID=A0A0R3AL20_9PSED|nr:MULTISPECIES: DUF1127 domain-containing protein [Pseudomonas]KRP70334.1 hypothetical protein TX23_20515 [Pseudomonas paralactis]MBC3257975.1 DUF1127 domain-containing protein [Pseudomonas paralactis]MBI6635806.1 DUF1127 domain-containing protein [Pseudomonas paralactis]MBJ2220136.1 DUF1127 domain-containing protein [Pseudomonas sp. MF7453]
MKGQKGSVLLNKGAFAGLFHRLARWQLLHQERNLLATLSDDALKDIGLNRADIEQESHRHFWEDPLRK